MQATLESPDKAVTVDLGSQEVDSGSHEMEGRLAETEERLAGMHMCMHGDYFLKWG